ncbi:MAG: uracil-DNA glycosylase [Alphaproteobacteria bacterium]
MPVIDAALHKEIVTALGWYVDIGVHEVILDEAEDYTKAEELPTMMAAASISSLAPVSGGAHEKTLAFLGKSDARAEAVKRAKSANTLDELKDEIATFDGIAIKKTASNIVFADGNPKAKIMVIGDAPAADEDRMGKPFVGASGQLLDKILACIDLSREGEELEKSVYITNILNWRPPGNRSPNPAEIEVSLPFIERHIQLIKPEIIILCGAMAAKSLLATSSSISRLRKSSHEYKTITQELGEERAIAAFPIYHPSDLINTPLQKRAVWEDMLKIQAKIHKS